MKKETAKKTIKKEVLKIKKDNIVNKLYKILTEFFDKNYVKIVDDTMITCPIGTFMKEEGIWGFDVDLSCIVENSDIIILLNLIHDVTKGKIDLIFFMGYHSVYNDDNICCGLVFEQDIEEYMDDNDCDYEDALEELSNKLIEDYKKETKEKVK
jgi:hypothetical protein